MRKLIDGRAFSPSVILSEAKDLTPVLATHMLLRVTTASIVRFLESLGMTTERARARKF
jgi:hypothetical protein